MIGSLTRLRQEERGAAYAATLTVFLVMIAHAFLETARDALFLANISATRLPWMYLALAVAAVALGQVAYRPNGSDNRRAIILLQLSVAAGTAAMGGLIRVAGDYGYYLLYVWTGIAASAILVRLWLHLGDRFTATQAKRAYPIVSAGSVAGILAGFALSSVITERLSAEALLWASALAFLVSAAVLGAGATGATTRAAASGEGVGAGTLAARARSAIADPYVRRIALVLFLGSVTATSVDYSFKSVVADQVAAADLGTFLARSYLLFNLLALAVLLVGSDFLVRRFSVTGSLALLPVALVVATVGWAFVGGVVAALLLKGADGALRWSTHKTAVELLYVPLSDGRRRRVKGIVDLVTQRGGQTVGSFLILGVMAFTEDVRAIVPIIAVTSLLWILAAARTREPYLDLFRDTLGAGAIEIRHEFPDLDVASLGTLVESLGSEDNGRVLAAMELLTEKSSRPLIPALILYHPSPQVVVRALDLFASAQRLDFFAMIPRLLDHEDAEVRAAALRAVSKVRPEAEVLRKGLEHDCPVVNVTALVGLAAEGWEAPDHVAEELRPHVVAGTPLARRMLARALRLRPVPALAPVLRELARASEAKTRVEAVHAMRAAGLAEYLPDLIDLLADRSVREEARQALFELGTPAFAALAAALADRSLPFAVRVHIPRTLSRFRDQRAADVLLRHLVVEDRGMIRYKCLRGLGGMIDNNPALRLDSALLDIIVEHTLQASSRALRARVVLERGESRTASQELLVALLRDKERFAIERLLRTLGLRYPAENFRRIQAGLTNGTEDERSSARELLESLLPKRLGRAVLALTDDVDAEQRLHAAAAVGSPGSEGYVELLGELVDEPSATLGALAATHAREIGLDIESLDAATPPARAVSRLRHAA